MRQKVAVVPSVVFAVAVSLAGPRGTTWAQPDEGSLRTSLGTAYAVQGRLGDAAKQLTRAVDLRPNHPAAMNNMANVLFMRGDRARALELYESALRADSKRSETRFNLGLLLYALGDTLASSEHLRKSLELASSPNVFLERLALSPVTGDAVAGEALADFLVRSALEQLHAWGDSAAHHLCWMEL